MARLLLLLLVMASAVGAQARPRHEWKLDEARTRGGQIEATIGDRPLRLGGAPAFYGAGDRQCLLRRPEDPVATVGEVVDPASLPKKAITVEAWVAVDVAQEWGGVLGAIEDNGEDERGWLLGFRGRKFCFALASEGARRLTYLTASTPFVLGQFHHVVGTYDGEQMRLYVDGALVAESAEQQGAIYYAERHQLVAAAYQDSNESYRMRGALRTLRLYDRRVPAGRIRAVYRRELGGCPDPEGASFTDVAGPSFPSLAELQPRINAAIDRGVAGLLRRQHRDGSWGYSIERYRNGPTALAVYALAKSGLPASHPSIRAALRFLAAEDPTKVYSYGCQLLALAGVDDGSQRHREWARRLTGQLLELESDQEPGGWAYPHGACDLSNTQFAVLGLVGAEQLGVDVDASVWRRIVKKTAGHQPFLRPARRLRGAASGRTRSDPQQGGYTYFEDGRTYPESGSMTAAGLCILAFADKLQGKKLGARTLSALHVSKTRALRWLEDNFTVTTNPGYPSTVYYYLYGVERVGALLGLEEFGGVPWYRAGAEWLVGEQDEDGSWARFDQTCFALLFLTRATGPTTGLSSRTPEVWKSGGDVRLAAKGRVRCSMWIDGFDAALSDKELRVARVRYELNGAEVGAVDGDPARPWTTESFLAEHRFGGPGPQTLVAVVELASGEVLRSGALQIESEPDVEAWMRANEALSAPNLLLDASTQPEASSETAEGAAQAAVDGLQATAWRCDPDDRTPTIFVRGRRPMRADRLVLFPADSSLLTRGASARVRKVAVTVGRRRREVTCPDDPLAPTVIDLGPAKIVRSVKIEVLDRDAAADGARSAGFAEIALQLVGK